MIQINEGKGILKIGKFQENTDIKLTLSQLSVHNINYLRWSSNSGKLYHNVWFCIIVGWEEKQGLSKFFNNSSMKLMNITERRYFIIETQIYNFYNSFNSKTIHNTEEITYKLYDGYIISFTFLYFIVLDISNVCLKLHSLIFRLINRSSLH